MTTSPNFKCFISYRRAGARAFAAVSLEQQLLANKFDVFLDTEGIEPGNEFPQVIESNLRQSHVVFVIIDEEWLVDKDNRRRLNDREDWVRREIELALEWKIPIIPLLIGSNVRMPDPQDLPTSLRPLTQFQGVPLRANEFKGDFGRILTSLRRRAEAQLEAQEILRKLREHWDRGNWLQIHKQLIEAKAKWGEEQGGLLQPPEISRRLEVAQELMRAVEAFGQRRFEAALEILSRVRLEDAPRNVACSIKVARVGARAVAASEGGRIDLLKEITYEYAAAKRDSIAEGLEMVPGLDEVNKVLSECNTEISYRRAVTAYQAGRYGEAQELLRPLGDFRDSAKLLTTCKQWESFFDAIRKREWDKARTVLATLGRGGDAPIVQRWRRWCNVMRRCIEVLDELGRGHVLIDPDVPWEGGECPYVVLGLPPTAHSQTIQQMSFNLQAKPGGMQSRDRNAWDALRHYERRLLADFCAYRVADQKRARALAQELVCVTQDSVPEQGQGALGDEGSAEGQDGKSSRSQVRQIGERLGEDAALFFRRMKMYDAAISELESQSRKAPDNARLLHHLGLAAAAQIHAGGRDPLNVDDDIVDFTQAWDRIVYAWGAVFADDRFWHQWWIDRQEVYQVSKAQVSEARRRIERYWLDELKSAGEGVRDHDLLFQTEVNGARAVSAAGGIPLKNGERRVIVGPMGARALGLQADVAEWAATFEPDCLAKEGWQKRVCVYFSELAEVVALAELGRHEDVLKAIAAMKKPARGDFDARNPGFARLPNREAQLRRALGEFEEQAHHKLAIDLISESPPRLQEAIERWRAALGAADRLGRRADLHLEVQTVVVTRANQLQSDESVDQLERLNNAIEFLETVRDSDLDGEKIIEAVVDRILERTWFMHNEHSDYQAARGDALRASSMARGAPGPRLALYAATISLALEKHLAGRDDLVRILLKEASALYAEGAEQGTNTRTMDEWKQRADELERLIVSPQRPPDADEAIRKLQRTLGDLQQSGNSGAHASDPFAEALLKQSRKDFEGAIDLYKKILQQHPDDRLIPTKLAMCYRAWVFRLIDDGTPQADVDKVVRQALESCPNSELLRDFQEAVTGEPT